MGVSGDRGQPAIIIPGVMAILHVLDLMTSPTRDVGARLFQNLVVQIYSNLHIKYV